MKNFPGNPINNESLKELAMKVLDNKFGLCVDIDGTISPIVNSYATVSIHPDARYLLNSLQEKLNVVAVISGRSTKQARKLVDLPQLTYVGNHGCEIVNNEEAVITVENPSRLEKELSYILKYTKESLSDVQGLSFENKGLSASIHYRGSKDPSLVHKRIQGLVKHLTPDTLIDVTRGRMVVNLLPKGISKGTALQWIVRHHNLNGIIYLGDDFTDLDAFKMIDHLNQFEGFLGTKVAVWSEEVPSEMIIHSDSLVNGVEGVIEFLERLNFNLNYFKSAVTGL